MKNKSGHALGGKDLFALNILLAYDNARTCRSVLEMLDRISTRARAKTRFNVNAFRFGLLERMDPVKWTAASAREAKLALVAFGETGVPGARFLRWLENWGRFHAGKDAALGLIPVGRATGQSVRRLVRILQESAARHHLDFIYDAESRPGML
jgi:hypothetical protein